MLDFLEMPRIGIVVIFAFLSMYTGSSLCSGTSSFCFISLSGIPNRNIAGVCGLLGLILSSMRTCRHEFAYVFSLLLLVTSMMDSDCVEIW
jgi:hypothetical protein